MSVVHNIIESVRGLAPYTLAVTEAAIHLDRNESPVDLPAEAKAEIIDQVCLQAWNRYPDFVPEDVLAGLGARHGLSARHVLIGNGSNELIQAVFTAAVGPGVKVYLPDPTFSLYRMMVLANEGQAEAIPLNAELGYDLEAWQRAAQAGDGHLVICSPNNPTGAVMGPQDLAGLAAATSRLVIVDEAYAQFGPHDVSCLVAEHDNVIVLRTFSKAIGLAGVRLGYALARPELVSEISKVKLPYNVGHFGLAVARYALAHPEVFEGLAAQLVSERGRLEAALSQLPFEAVRGGHANFVLVKTASAHALFGHLVARGILVRDVGRYSLLQHCLRITVGTPADNDALLAGCRDFFGEP